MVVIAIIGVLIALLLPAVQAAREAARRMQCTNHVKQIVLGLQNYHDTHLAFPTGAMDNSPGTPNGALYWNTWYFILPFVEQQARYDRFVSDYIPNKIRPDNGSLTSFGLSDSANSAGTPNSKTSNTNMPELFHPIGTFLCPSDVLGKTPSHTNDTARTSYGMCRGDRYSVGNALYSSSSEPPRGLFCRGNYWASMASVTDGTSNTIAVSEILSAQPGTAKTVKGGVANYNPTGTTPLTGCWNMVSTGDRTTITSATSDGRRASALFSGMAQSTGFHTILPPNGPTCASGWSVSVAMASA
ncbi:MAG: DUF1559 domain-containing protein, partial [Planctomycetaceae bacterium]|nr:DUF1559 domain-containing protein [Planctomycetaceae bacterium]